MTADRTPGRMPGRKRRANAGGRERLCEVWATPAERAALLERCAEAGGITVPRLLVEATLSSSGETPSERRAIVVELFALRRVLAGLATNLARVARRADVGEGVPVAEVRGELLELRRLAGPGGRIDAAIDVVSAEGVSA